MSDLRTENRRSDSPQPDAPDAEGQGNHTRIEKNAKSSKPMSKQVILRCSLYGMLAVVATGAAIGLVSNSLFAADGISTSAFDKENQLLFPDWKPMFEDPATAPARPAANGQKAGAVEEVMTLAPAETLDEAIRVAALKQGSERIKALASLWKHYAQDVMYNMLTTRIEKRTLEEATLAAEILALGADAGERKLTEMLTGSDERLADRTAFALANAGSVAVQVFGQVLETASGKPQYRAAWGLGQVGGAEAAQLLATQSRHPELRMRVTVLDALAATAPADRKGLLLAFGDDPHPTLKRRVAEIYAQEPNPESLGVLQRLAQEVSPDVRIAAVVALGQQKGGPAFVQPLLTDPLGAIRAEAARIMAEGTDDAQRAELLKSRDSVVRLAAFEALEPRSDVSPEIFVAMLGEPDAGVRGRALQKVLTSQSANTASVAAAFLADGEGVIQHKALDWLTSQQKLAPRMLTPLADTGVATAQKQAVEQLLAWNTPEALEVLGYFSRVPDAALRQQVASRMSKNPSTWSLESIARVMKDPDETVRRTALMALQQRPEDEAMQLLVRFLQDDSAALRLEAANALGRRRDPRSAIALGQRSVDTSEDVRKASVRALKSICDDVSAGAIVAYLQDSSPEVREQALTSLVKIGTPVALGFVGEVSRHPNADLRRSAIQMLQVEGRKENAKRAVVAAQLTQFFQDPLQEVQIAAMEATGKVAHGEAIQALAVMSTRQETNVRLVAVDALRQVRDGRAVQALDIYRADEAVAVRQGAYRGLAQVGGSKGYELLLEGLEDPAEGVRTTVIQQVAELRLGMSVPKLTERLKTAEFHEQRQIIHALGKIRSPEATAALVELTASKGLIGSVMAKQALDEATSLNAEAFEQRAFEEAKERASKQKRFWGKPRL